MLKQVQHDHRNTRKMETIRNAEGNETRKRNQILKQVQNDIPFLETAKRKNGEGIETRNVKLRNGVAIERRSPQRS